MKRWNAEKTQIFYDEFDTKFIKGPFMVEDKEYDYKLIDKDGEDYCTIDQMECWDIEMVREVSE